MKTRGHNRNRAARWKASKKRLTDVQAGFLDAAAGRPGYAGSPAFAGRQFGHRQDALVLTGHGAGFVQSL